MSQELPFYFPQNAKTFICHNRYYIGGRGKFQQKIF